MKKEKNDRINMTYLKNLINHYNEKAEYSKSRFERWHLNKEFKIVNKILDRIIRNDSKKEALDIACNTGRYAFALGKKGLNVLGIDTSDKALKVAKGMKTKLGMNNVYFKNVDATKLKIRKKFDIIVLMELLHHLPDEVAIKLFKQAIMLLKSKGYLIFDLKNRNNLIISRRYKKKSSEKLLLIARNIDFFRRIIKKLDCKIIIKNSLVTPFWQIEPFVIIVLKKK